ncbi:alpha-L-rhamnosidase C-terminal domain-containing protein [Paenibacillus sp. RS8]|uniref:alpha-L-rhamnosidase C-terminal domain-containing protein n=1 Tax=Paenibacillus sp. RS8 TaxID=3242681 RepID=UPI0035C0761A
MNGEAIRNHYSPGSVCEWLFDTVGGIRISGENSFIIQPVPGGTLIYAIAKYVSIYGTVTSKW